MLDSYCTIKEITLDLVKLEIEISSRDIETMRNKMETLLTEHNCEPTQVLASDLVIALTAAIESHISGMDSPGHNAHSGTCMFTHVIESLQSYNQGDQT